MFISRKRKKGRERRKEGEQIDKKKRKARERTKG